MLAQQPYEPTQGDTFVFGIVSLVLFGGFLILSFSLTSLVLSSIAFRDRNKSSTSVVATARTSASGDLLVSRGILNVVRESAGTYRYSLSERRSSAMDYLPLVQAVGSTATVDELSPTGFVVTIQSGDAEHGVVVHAIAA